MMRKLLLLFVCAFASIGAWAKPVEQDQETGRWYIGGKPEGNYFTIENGVAIFHVAYKTEGPDANKGVIEDSWDNISNQLNNANPSVTRIKFANDCQINQGDLECFLKDNKYYVDLFDITNGSNKMTPETIDPIVTGAVAKMVEKGWQAKGIILPLNTISGTSTVEKSCGDSNNPKPTFTEYAAYYRDNTTQKTATIYAIDTRMSGDNWQNMNNNTEAQTHYNTAYAHLSSHSEVAQAETYIVSTNNKIKNSDQGLDVSNIPAYASVPEGAEPVPTTKITIINDEMVYKNSTSRTFLADIIVEGTEGAFAAAVANTNIKLTPCEELIFKGTVGSADIAAINDFSDASVAGPQIYNLAEASGVAKTDLSSITNTKVEYIILPHAMAEEQIEKSCFSTSLTNSETFKAAIAASTDKKKLSAYVNVAGSLAKARCYATGNSADQAGGFKPTQQGLTSVILGGNLNSSDISTSQSNGNGLQSENNTITSIDLENAYFANADHMKFGDNGGAGLTNLTEVKLPTDSLMKIIPTECFHNVRNLQSVHIPYNFEKIKARAFEGTDLTHITTEDANGALIDNGPNTYTFSANINELGENPQNNYVFPENKLITDVYCLAMETPKCYKGTFPPNMVYANGGIYAGVYCRDKYINYDKNGTPINAVTMLHFPSQESYVDAKGNATGYNDMVEKYTDPTRDYHKKDQTGAVDANGNPLRWPDQGEVLNTRNMALAGHIWTDYKDMKYQEGGTAHQTSIGDPDGDTKPFFPDYVGWHEFVLSVATYVDPDEEVENDTIIREYQEAGWYTICIPFNLSIKQVREWLGVPKSEGNVICKLYDKDGNLVEDDVKSPIMPDIRQLYAVERAKGGTKKDNGKVIKQNMVYLRMTHNLWDGDEAHYLEFTLDAEPDQVIKYTDAHINGTTNIDDDNCMIGGRPYIIMAYKRKGETISRQNIGKMIMTRYADELKRSASCVQNGCYEQLGATTGQNANLLTLRFAKPYENHKVQAMNGNPAAPGYMEYVDPEDNTSKRYFYTMIGQFWEQTLPMYCLYMSKGNWYRYTGAKDAQGKPYTWDPYKCVIIPTVEKADADHPKSGGYRDNSAGASNYPQPKAGTTDLLESDFKLQFLDGRNDDDFENYEAAKHVFVFDDEGVTEYDENGVIASAIENIDGESTSISADSKVYNISGQHVGNMRNGLSKGMYIVNGKKFVVK